MKLMLLHAQTTSCLLKCLMTIISVLATFVYVI